MTATMPAGSRPGSTVLSVFCRLMVAPATLGFTVNTTFRLEAMSEPIINTPRMPADSVMAESLSFIVVTSDTPVL